MQNHNLLEHFLTCFSVSTDTRNITPGCIFFALKGENFNGNKFATKALEAGASYAVVDESHFNSDPRIVLVKDSLLALQSLAREYRNTFDFPVIGITGSNGKTTTKELVRNVLSKKYNVSATIGNLNNHIGVPLTLLSVPKDCNMAVVEMGANHQKEIEALCSIARPNFGTITNIGKAHLEGFGGIAGVRKGKKELFDFLKANDGQIFVNETDEVLCEMAKGGKLLPYGKLPNESLQIVSDDPYLNFKFQTSNFISDTIRTNLTGSYNLANMAAAIKIGRYFNVRDEDVKSALESYKPDNNRSELAHTGKNSVIKDYYNANPTSTAHALQNLAKMSAEKKYFVIGDMLEMGSESADEHTAILQLANDLGLEGITVGSEYGAIPSKFKNFGKSEEALEFLKVKDFKGVTVLIKGSRGIKLEKVMPVF